MGAAAIQMATTLAAIHADIQKTIQRMVGGSVGCFIVFASLFLFVAIQVGAVR